jgi:mannose-6-phosphate isomerase
VSTPPETPETGFDPTMHPLGAAGSAERRPWGEFVILDDSEMCKVKRITVDSGQRLSYQMHKQRSEHWTVVQGTAIVTIDGTDVEVSPGRTVEIPVGAAHRVRNDDVAPLVFIEVQTGTYFGEDDIVRFEDDYGRASTD